MRDKKIIDYKIATPTDTYGNLDVGYILGLISQGWQPLGGLCSYNTSMNNNAIYQVMVKYG